MAEPGYSQAAAAASAAAAAGEVDRNMLVHKRVVQRNLVYLVGMPLPMCREDVRARAARASSQRASRTPTRLPHHPHRFRHHH